MKKLTQEQIYFLTMYVRGKWVLNNKGEIDVDGNVDFEEKDIEEIPVQFGKVSGYFDCSWNNLTSLKGSPRWVGGYFRCNNKNKLTSLKYCPKYIGGRFTFFNNKIENLDYFPEYVGGYIDGHYHKGNPGNFTQEDYEKALKLSRLNDRKRKIKQIKELND